MEISKLLDLFSNDGLTCAERVEFSKWKVNRLKVEQLMPRKCICVVLWQNPILQSSIHQIFTHMYSTVSIGPSFKENLTGFSHTPPSPSSHHSRRISQDFHMLFFEPKTLYNYNQISVVKTCLHFTPLKQYNINSSTHLLLRLSETVLRIYSFKTKLIYY